MQSIRMRGLGALLLAALVSGCTAPHFNRVRVAINGVEGGKASDSVRWLEQVLPPDVALVQDGSSDESFKARLVLDLYGGTGADIYSFDPFWTAQMASAGLLEPLDDLLAKWPDWAQYPPSMRAMGSYQGHVYVIPTLTDVRGIYYRKDLFARCGLPQEWHPRNWADILAAGEALRKLPGVIPIQWDGGKAFGEATTMQGFSLVLLSAGGSLYGGKWVAGGTAMQRALGFYRTVYVTRHLADLALQMDPKGRERSFEMFRDGHIGIYPESSYMWQGVLSPNGPWSMPDRNQVVGWAPMPGGGQPGDPSFVSISGGAGFMLNRHSPRAAAAWKVLQQLCGVDSQVAMMRIDTFIPTRTDLLHNPVFTHDQELAREVQVALPYTTFRPGLPEYPRVSDLVQKMTEAVINGTAIDTALAAYRNELIRVVGAEHVDSAEPQTPWRGGRSGNGVGPLELCSIGEPKGSK
ncbi:MAG: extracellular solute-binding protein [Candidatus Xenobia bacterium]